MRLPTPVWKFAASGLAILVLIACAGVFILDRIAQDDAVGNAREIAAAGRPRRGRAEPDRGPSRTATRRRLARLDRIIKTRVLRGSDVRVKLWSRDGTILYSDEPRLIGQKFQLSPAARATLEAGTEHAGVADLSKPENQYDRDHGKLLEVYVGMRTPDGAADAVRAVPRLLVRQLRGTRCMADVRHRRVRRPGAAVADPDAARGRHGPPAAQGAGGARAAC